MRSWSCLAILGFCLVQTIYCLPVEDADPYLKPLSPENLERLRNLGKDELAEEISGQYQGDIVITPDQLKEYRGENKAKTGLVNTNYRWPNNTIPYMVEEEYFSQSHIDYIHLAAQKIQDVTCLKFVPYNPEIHTNYVSVQGQNGGCWSYVGNLRRGRQALNLQIYDLEVGCFRLYTIVHEFLHALGFFHMHSATERDEYVEIVWDKIQAGVESNFENYGESYITNLGVEYDYGSVMHYSNTSGSIDGSETIVALKPLNGDVMGQRLRLSDRDISRINRMYCDESTEPTTEAPQPPVNPPSLVELFRSIRVFLSGLLGNIFGGIFGNIRNS